MKVEPFDYDACGDNSGYKWKNWLKSFEYCLNAGKVTSEEEKFALLLHFAGPKIQEIYDALPQKEEEKDEISGPWASGYVLGSKYEDAISRLDEFFLPKKNSTYERHMFRQIRQKESEPFANFAIRLRIQAEKCDYGDALETNVKEMVISNCRSDKMRRDLMKITIMRAEATLDDILKVAKATEGLYEQEKPFKQNTNTTSTSTMVDDVNKIETKKPWVKRNQTNNRDDGECTRCGHSNHKANDPKCPAKGQRCHKCNGRDHFMRKCRSKKRMRDNDNQQDDSNRQVDNNQTGAASSKKPKTEEIKYVANDSKHYIFCLTSDDDCDDNEVQCKIGNVNTKAIIDSGSQFNIIGIAEWNELKAANIIVEGQLKGTDKEFSAYGKYPLSVVGKIKAEVQIGPNAVVADFYVLNRPGKILIGLITAKKLKVLEIHKPKKVLTINNVDDKVEKLGKIKDVVVTIPVKENVKPVIQAYRRVAAPLEDAVNDKLDKLLQQDIIERVKGPAQWVSPMVVVPKDNGDVRICIDMRRVNEAVQRENHVLPTIEDFLPHIGKSKYFSLYDVANAFHQV